MKKARPAKASITRREATDILAQMKTSSTYDFLPVTDMKVDSRYQRPLRTSWVRRLVPDFNADLIGSIVVSRRTDNTLWILDGQHRVELIRAVGWGDQKVYCEIFDDLEVRQEAALFLHRNNKVSVRPLDKFMASLTEEDELACGVAKIVKEAGLIIDPQPRPGAIHAVSALLAIYRGGGIASEKEGAIALKRALQTILAAWGDADRNFQGQIIEGIGLVYLKHGDEVDQDTLASKLAKMGGGADGLIGQARTMRSMHSGRAAVNLAEVIVLLLNKGRRGNKLERWWA